MNILFISRFFKPHFGGVEKHLYKVSKELLKMGNNVSIITEKYDKNLDDFEIVDNVKVYRFSYPHIKILGLFLVWLRLSKYIKIIKESDVVHVHDVFVWYLPFSFILRDKKVFTTIHGLEWGNPLPWISLMQKRIAKRFSSGIVGVGFFLNKYLDIDFNLITYGASDRIKCCNKKINSIVFVGRLQKDTGVLEFTKWLGKQKDKYVVDFCGDGELKNLCSNFGEVHGFVDPKIFISDSKYCVPGGYLAALEGLNADCSIRLFWNDKIKEDYWKMSPFWKLKGKELKKWAREQTWKKLANEYLSLYNSIK